MTETDKEFETLAEFKRDPTTHLRRLRKRNAVLVLTTKGKASFVVQDAASYQKLRKQADEAEMLTFLRESLADAEAGRLHPMREALEQLRRSK